MCSEEIPQKILDAREKFTVTKVHAPTLKDNLVPDFKLLNMECPFDKDGHCSNCEHMTGVYTPEGSVFANYSYEGYCDHPTTD